MKSILCMMLVLALCACGLKRDLVRPSDIEREQTEQAQ